MGLGLGLRLGLGLKGLGLGLKGLLQGLQGLLLQQQSRQQPCWPWPPRQGTVLCVRGWGVWI